MIHNNSIENAIDVKFLSMFFSQCGGGRIWKTQDLMKTCVKILLFEADRKAKFLYKMELVNGV